MPALVTAPVPVPIPVGEEMHRLARFHRDITWTGTIEEGGMGPGTPAMTATGWGRHHTIQDGRWIVGEYEQDQLLADGTFVLRWQLHWVAGWDPASAEYRATIADNYGHADVLRGWIEGDRLIFETIGAPAVRLRLVWDASDPTALIWRNEASAAGGPWTLVEEYRCVPLAESLDTMRRTAEPEPSTARGAGDDERRGATEAAGAVVGADAAISRPPR
jgi:hypothetical protein